MRNLSRVLVIALILALAGAVSLVIPPWAKMGPGLSEAELEAYLAGPPTVADLRATEAFRLTEGLLASEASASHAAPPDTTPVYSETRDGSRLAHLHLPCQRGEAARSCDPGPGPFPLVVAVHGFGMSTALLASSTGFSVLADRERFAVVYPEGISHSWHGGGCCGVAERDGVDDPGYLDALVDQLRAYPEISDTRSYFAGISNGAMLGYRLACGDRGRFRAFVLVSGSVTADGGACGPTRSPRPLLALNGTADTVVPLNGCQREDRGSICATNLDSDLAPVRNVLGHFRKHSGCTSLRSYTYGPRQQRTDGLGCTRPGPVQILVQGAGHRWAGPGTHSGSAAALGLRETYTVTAWKFFSHR